MIVADIPGIEMYKDTWGLSLRSLIIRFHRSPELILYQCERYNIVLRNKSHPSKILTINQIEELLSMTSKKFTELREIFGITPNRLCDILRDFNGYTQNKRSSLDGGEINRVLAYGIIAVAKNSYTIKRAMLENNISFIDDSDLIRTAITKDQQTFIYNNKDIFKIWEIAAFLQIKFEILEEYYIINKYKYRLPGIFDYETTNKKKAIEDYNQGCSKSEIAIKYGLSARVLHILLRN